MTSRRRTRRGNTYATVVGTAVTALALGTAALLRRHREVSRVAPDLRARWLYAPVLVPPVLPWRRADEALVRVGRRVMRRSTAVQPGVALERCELAPQDGNGAWCYLYLPSHRSSPAGALLWIHGGNFVMGGAAQDHGLCSRLASEVGVPVLSVEYRLAPEHPYPAALDDCTSALLWLRSHAAELGVDPCRVAVGGASAGGGLAASLAHRATDEGMPPALQLLLYPMLDDRTGPRATPGGRGRLALTPRMARYGWRQYLGRQRTDARSRPYAVPARRRDLRGLPPAWLGVGDLDLLVDEAIQYAARLRDAGVECDLRIEAGMYHGADAACPRSAPTVDRFHELLCTALRSAAVPPGR